MFDACKGVDRVCVGGERNPGDREVLQSTQRVDAEVSVPGYFPVAEKVVFEWAHT
jgi:hypothetical protein